MRTTAIVQRVMPLRPPRAVLPPARPFAEPGQTETRAAGTGFDFGRLSVHAPAASPSPGAPLQLAGRLKRKARKKALLRKKKSGKTSGRKKESTGPKGGITKPKKTRQTTTRGKYGLGMHGAKKREQKRLTGQFGTTVSGSTHESEHTIGFEPLNQTSGLKRGSPGRATLLENRAPAYQEVKELHREHIGTGTTNTVDQSGFNSHTYREYQRSLLESGDVSSSVQLNQLGYSFMKNFSNTPKTEPGKQSNDSFNQMVGNMQSVTYAKGDEDVTVPVDSRQRAEMHLSRTVAQTGKWPSVSEENVVRKLYGLKELPEEKKDDKMELEDK